MKALIVVDVQNDFLPGGALAVPGGNEIIPIINRLQPAFDLVVATQDWHPADHKSFASAHPAKKPFDVIDLNGLSQVLWPDHCVQETAGANFASALEGKRIEAIFKKGMDREIDSYSGFFDNGKRKATGMAGYLKDRGVQSVTICGLAGDFCVYYTAQDALDLGFEASIIAEATRAIDANGFKKAMEIFKEKNGILIDHKEDY